MDVFLHLSLSSVILIDSSTESPVHVLMLSIQAVRGLPRLRAPGIVPCIISFSRQLPCIQNYRTFCISSLYQMQQLYQLRTVHPGTGLRYRPFAGHESVDECRDKAVFLLTVARLVDDAETSRRHILSQLCTASSRCYK